MALGGACQRSLADTRPRDEKIWRSTGGGGPPPMPSSLTYRPLWGRAHNVCPQGDSLVGGIVVDGTHGPGIRVGAAEARRVAVINDHRPRESSPHREGMETASCPLLAQKTLRHGFARVIPANLRRVRRESHYRLRWPGWTLGSLRPGGPCIALWPSWPGWTGRSLRTLRPLGTLRSWRTNDTPVEWHFVLSAPFVGTDDADTPVAVAIPLPTSVFANTCVNKAGIATMRVNQGGCQTQQEPKNHRKQQD